MRVPVPRRFDYSPDYVNDLTRELGEAVVGTLFLAIGLAAIAAASSARPRRDLPSFWFGVFALAYGVRLAAQSTPTGDHALPYVPSTTQANA